MDPIAFQIFGISVHWYGIMAGVGFLSALWFCQRKKSHAAMTDDQVVNFCFWIMFSGVIGARINYVIVNWSRDFEYAPWHKVFHIWEGGLVYYGGFIAATLFILLYCHFNKLEIRRVIDLFAMALPLGHGFGRIGCFLQGCCYGKETDCFLGFQYPKTQIKSAEGVRYVYEAVQRGLGHIHPVQIYEASANFILFVILYNVLGRLKFGKTAALYLMCYSMIRFSTECLRGEYVKSDMWFEILKPGQMVSVILFPIGLFLWFYFSYSKHATTPPVQEKIDPSSTTN